MIHIVLYHPEIPENTGNIMRTCVASGTKLHIIGPIPFSLQEKHLRRAGLDYIKKNDFVYYEDYQEFLKMNENKNVFYISRYGNKTYSDIDYSKIEEDIYLMFGRESSGINHDILRINYAKCLRIPMVDDARSLNLSNCVALVLYEVLRQKNFPNLAESEVIKGENFLFDEIQKD